MEIMAYAPTITANQMLEVLDQAVLTREERIAAVNIAREVVLSDSIEAVKVFTEQSSAETIPSRDTAHS